MGKTALALCIAVTAAWAVAGPQTPAYGQKTPAATTSTAKRAKRVVSGFRMEGDPAIETVFGDSERYKKHVDDFYDLQKRMRRTRAAFQRYVRATQATLEAHKRRCPTDAVAPLYYQAHVQGLEYRRLGAELEANYTSIKKLDDLGETTGLTPDYRWRVNRTRRLYRAALVDYREMRAVFDDQLASDLAFHRCKKAALLAAGKDAKPLDAPAADEPAPEPGKVKLAAATFFIDNTSCDHPLAVYVDGALVGEVASESKAAFQAQPGRHSMCLIPATSDDACGDPGTERTASLHDGWTMTLRCDD